MAGHRGSDRQQPPIWQLRPLPYRLIGEQTGVSLWRIRDCIRLSYRSWMMLDVKPEASPFYCSGCERCSILATLAHCISYWCTVYMVQTWFVGIVVSLENNVLLLLVLVFDNAANSNINRSKVWSTLMLHAAPCHSYYSWWQLKMPSGKSPQLALIRSTLVEFHPWSPGLCGVVIQRGRLFDKMPWRNIISCTTMISGYVEDG